MDNEVGGKARGISESQRTVFQEQGVGVALCQVLLELSEMKTEKWLLDLERTRVVNDANEHQEDKKVFYIKNVTNSK